MTTILAAIDDSAAAQPVLATALAIAPLLDAHVRAVHVAPDRGDGQTTAAAANAMNIPLDLVKGDPFEEIVRLVDSDDVVAVVLGARARRTGRRPAGRLALALASAIVKPVVMVPPDARPPARIRRVLVAMEGTNQKARDMVRVIELGAAADLELIVVHVNDEESIPSFCDKVQYETEAYAKEFLARYLPRAPEAQLHLRVGVPVDEILAAADDLAPDMLAIGWPRTDDPARGDVGRELVNRSRIPLLLVAVTDRNT